MSQAVVDGPADSPIEVPNMNDAAKLLSQEQLQQQQGATTAPPPPAVGKVKALRKRRKDLGSSNPRAPASGKKGGCNGSPQQQQQPFRRRCARARWAVLMFFPAFCVLFFRSDRVEAETGVPFFVLVAGAFTLLCTMALNELLGACPRVVYVACFCGAFAWGGTIEATRDLIALRLGSMVVLGLCCGMLRYHWGDEGHKIRSPLSNSPPLGASPKPKSPGIGLTTQERPLQYFTASVNGVDGYSSSSTAYLSTDAGPNTHQQQHYTLSKTDKPEDSSSFPSQPAAPLPSHVTLERIVSRLIDFAYFLRSHVGLGITATVGETLGCALLVPQWGEVVSVSWMGYLAVIVVPVVVYKVSSWTSHILVLLFGSRVNTADASRLLLLYWVITTVLGIGIFFFTVGWLVANIITFVWSLQLLTTPYAIFFELVAYESRKSQAVNPYDEIVEQYGDHITSIRNAKEAYLH